MITKNLRMLLAEHNTTLHKVCKDTGLDYRSVNRFYNLGRFDLDVVTTIAKYFSLTPDQIVEVFMPQLKGE